MKSPKILSVILLLFCCLHSENNWAWGHGHFGFYYGAPFYPFYGYAYPYYAPVYPPAVVTVPAAPPTYVQQAPPAPVVQQNKWYYCTNPEGYYPYVKECPGGWQQVEPSIPH